MADLSRVLQALGAILQGGGGTLTAIDEDKRKRERERVVNEQLAAQTTAMQEAAADRERGRTMEGWSPVPEGGLPPLAPQGAPGPRGMPMGAQQPPDQRIVSGGMFRDPNTPSPNEMIASAENRRQMEQAGMRFMEAIAGDPDFLALAPERQVALSKLVSTGVVDGASALQRMSQQSDKQQDAALQDFYFVGSQKLARDLGMDQPPSVDGGPAPNFPYDRLYNVLYNGKMQERMVRLSRQLSGGGGGGGMTAGQSFDRTVTAASGDALILALEGKSIQQIASELATKGYGSLEQGIRIQIAKEVFESVREEGDQGSLLDLQVRPRTGSIGSINQMITGGRQGGGAFGADATDSGGPRWRGAVQNDRDTLRRLGAQSNETLLGN